VLLVLAAAGCGGGSHNAPIVVVTTTATPTAAADCLNSDAFLVEAAGTQITGSSPGGINFTVTFHTSPAAAAVALAHLNRVYAVEMAAAVVDDAGNPPLHRGGTPMRLSPDELATLRLCIEIHRPG